MKRESHAVTLRLLAQKLNIHVSTVSRVLNGSEADAAKAASKAMIERIRSLAAEYSYKPNPYAINLRKQKSNLIGVLVPRLSDYVWAAIYEGIEESALSKGYFTYVTNSYDLPERRRQQISLAETRRVDGLLLGDTQDTQQHIDFLKKLSLPFVLVLRHTGNFLSVTCDDYKGGMLVARHLFERGHRQVAVIAGDGVASTGLERTAGFVDFYREAGHPVAPERIARTTFDTQGGREGASRLMREHSSLTALFAVNDFAAIGAMGAMREAGITPGQSMALVGFNDTPLAAELPIPLSTIRSPLRTIGEKAMDLLIRHLKGVACESEQLVPELVIRESSSFSIQ